MRYTGEFAVYEDIIQEMMLVYQHDKRPWMIGFSGGKDSTLLCCLVMEMLQRLPAEKRNKTVYIVSSDTMVENPIVGNYMHKMSEMIGAAGASLGIQSDIIYPKVEDTFCDALTKMLEMQSTIYTEMESSGLYTTEEVTETKIKKVRSKYESTLSE